VKRCGNLDCLCNKCEVGTELGCKCLPDCDRGVMAIRTCFNYEKYQLGGVL